MIHKTRMAPRSGFGQLSGFNDLVDWLVGRRIGLVVQGVHGTVSDLQKVDVPGDNTWHVPDVALERQHGIELSRRDVVRREPYRDFNGDGDAVKRVAVEA